MKRAFQRRAPRLILVFLVLCVFPALVGAENLEPVGSVREVVGDVAIHRWEREVLTAAPGMAAFAGDRIITGADARATVLLVSDSRLELGPDTELAVDDYTGTDADPGGPSIFRMAFGVVRAFVQSATGGPAPMEIHTPTAVVGVRGTTFDTAVGLDAATFVAVDEGEVFLEDADNTETVLSQGQTGELSADAPGVRVESVAPGRPRDWRGWREKRQEAALTRMPDLLPRYRARFDRMAERCTLLSKKVLATCDAIDQRLEKARQEGRKRPNPAKQGRIRERLREFRRAVRMLRRVANKPRAVVRHCRRINGVLQKNKDRYDQDEYAAMTAHLSAIDAKGRELNELTEEARRRVRQTIIQLKAFRVLGPDGVER